MSMFDRNVKIQFNRMKYAALVDKNLPNKYNIKPISVLTARGFYVLFGFLISYNLMNFDVFFYKSMMGVNRWRHRVENLIFGHHHGHEHGLVGFEDHSHGHGHAADAHHKDEHSKDSHNEKHEEKH